MGFRFRILLPHEHESVDDGGDEVDGQLPLPVDSYLVIENPSNNGSYRPCRRAMMRVEYSGSESDFLDKALRPEDWPPLLEFRSHRRI